MVVKCSQYVFCTKQTRGLWYAWKICCRLGEKIGCFILFRHISNHIKIVQCSYWLTSCDLVMHMCVNEVRYHWLWHWLLCVFEMKYDMAYRYMHGVAYTICSQAHCGLFYWVTSTVVVNVFQVHTHIFHEWFTCTGTILWLPQCQ